MQMLDYDWGSKAIFPSKAKRHAPLEKKCKKHPGY
jgi:hypothetical protein